MLFGNRGALQFELTWSSRDRSLARGRLKALLRNSIIWSDEDGRGISWTWIELLEYLANAWPFLKYEESFPSGTFGSEAIELLQHGGPKEDREYGYKASISEEEYVFLRRHNLATGVDGVYLPPISILREGLNALVLSGYTKLLLPLEEVLNTLTSLGDALATYLKDQDDERAKHVIESWANKEPTFYSIRRIKLGGSEFLYEDIFEPSNEEKLDESSNVDDDDSPLLAAARMTAPVQESIRRDILLQIKSFKHNETARLDELSLKAVEELPRHLGEPHEQGSHLAMWTRNELRIHPARAVDPKQVLESLNVEVVQKHLGTFVIDAVGCWGGGYGPAVIVNYDGEHAQAFQGRRATLAHELCHLLVDRNGSLPAAEVLGGATPGLVEKRANAFAAEFLLPRASAALFLENHSNTLESLFRLKEHFGVSKEIAGWQVRHGGGYANLDTEGKNLVRLWVKGAGDDYYDY